MSSFFEKIKAKTIHRKSGSASKGNNEQSFSIQPHPAKSNDPADLNPPQPGGGLNSGGAAQAYHARDPHIPSQQIQNSLEQPLSREELKARSAELNK